MRNIRITSEVQTVPTYEMQRALGYLCSWSLHNYDEVQVYIGSDCDISASYTNNTNQHRYFIAAIKDKQGKYSMHS